ncbi:Hypothetical predicted protein [Mytilus galloprovincialis]|uniref:Uncharacterized protein n=1 Tax=Mytilus galloprovincialis TaxID=29158 RepID=A0A8B6GM56_MYTGA|nr:Hypothetical predicted protein [Mytilus galloprovincialis]
MANRIPPYEELPRIKALIEIRDKPPPCLTGNVSVSYKDFVEKCLQKIPRQKGALVAQNLTIWEHLRPL